MASLALAAAGALIAPAGHAALGWAVGSALGSLLFPPSMPDVNQFGPRLSDLKVQVSTYGQPIARVYGRMRLAGNIIWSTPIVETAHTTSQSSGGKGGGGQTVTQTTYTYSQSFAVGICEGEADAVLRIWANGELIYNVDYSAQSGTINASVQNAGGLRFYPGSETQEPDSLIQAHQGIALTPAYRGLAYIVFEDLQLALYGNRTPNLEFEIVKSRTLSGTIIQTASGTPVHTGALFPVSVGYVSASNVGIQLYSHDLVAGASKYIGTYINANTAGASDGSDYYYSWGGSGQEGVYRVRDGIFPGTRLCAAGYYGGSVSVGEDFILFTPTNVGGLTFLYNRDNGAEIASGNATPVLQPSCGTRITKSGDLIVLGYAVSPNRTVGARMVRNGAVLSVAQSATAPSGYDMSPSLAYGRLTEDSKGNPVWCGTVWVNFATRARVLKWDLATNTILGWGKDYAHETLARTSHPTGTDAVWVHHFDGAYKDKFRELSLDTMDFTGNDITVPTGIWINSNENYLQPNLVLLGYGSSYAVMRLDTPTVQTPTTGDIAEAICLESGLTLSDIDTTQLTDQLEGYTVATQSQSRAALEPILEAFFIDAVEVDGKIKFVKRGQAAVETIYEDDLAAHISETTLPDAITSERMQEMELPQEIAIQYLDGSSAYAVGSQYSRRLVTRSKNKLARQYAMNLPGTKAKQIADVLLYNAWRARTTIRFSTSTKFSHLAPADVVDLVVNNKTYTVRLLDVVESGGICNFTAALEDSSIYTQTAAAAPILKPDDTVGLTGLTKLLLLDIPLLRAVDDGIGFYSAACGYQAGWHGSQMFKSADNGVTWDIYGDTHVAAAKIGSTIDALGTFDSGNIFDEKNTVTVSLLQGELSSSTELGVLNGANVALLGNEVIQYKNATLIADKTYTLSGLLRGRRGTEWSMGAHAAGERFCVLESETVKIILGPSSEYNLARKYRGVSIGGYLVDAATVNFTNTGVAQECYAPVHFFAYRNAAGDVIASWVRRARLNADWRDYVDVPVGEASESYTLEVWNSAYTVLKRTINVSTPTATYTAAQQTTDWGGLQPTVYLRVYQNSALVGGGYPNTKAL